MLYYLSNLSDWAAANAVENDVLKAMNVFSYITFRAICAGVTAFLLSLLFGNFVIRKLISLKFGQPIRTAAEVHKLYELHGAKKGTPTMGGILLIGTLLVSSILWARWDNPFVWLVLFSTVFLGLIGLYDDWLKVAKKNSDGISSRLKFLLQCILAGIFTWFFLTNPKASIHPVSQESRHSWNGWVDICFLPPGHRWNIERCEPH
jgi:phospho-N-acetylmuramoyl-pentapeptide-transferase